MERPKVGSVELNLLHALQWEQHDFKVSNTKKLWDIDEAEAAIVVKYMENRIADIKSRIK